VGRHLTEPPVLVRSANELRLGRRRDPCEEAVPLGCGRIEDDADGLAEPRGPVRRVVHKF